jgi:YD repeat-containing protein
MAAPGKALEAAVFDVHEGPDGKAVEEPTGGTTWTWADAVLAAQDSWRIVYGHERTTHIELDALGRQLVFVEETEQPGCHRYEQLSTYAGDVLLDQTTTCDGGLFEHRWSVLDAEGRVSRAERIFLGNPTSTTHEVQIYAWDACGAPTLREHTWNGKVTWREELTWDAAGRLVEKVLVNAPGGEEHAVPYEYDEEGRVVAVGEQRWIRDAEGRIVAFETGGAAAPPELGGGALHTITYSYCD